MNSFRITLQKGVISSIQNTLSKICHSMIKLDKDPGNSTIENLLKSNLFSGGIENRFLDSFSYQTKTALKGLALIENDSNLLEYIMKEEYSEEDLKLLEIIEPGKDVIVDRLILLFQWDLTRKHIWARTGGEEGMILTRCAFALMVKFNQQFDNFYV